MSIASEITSMGNNLKADYEGLVNLGVDLTNVDKNIENIRTCLDSIYTNYPKVTGTDGTLVTLSNCNKGKLQITEKGNSTQDGTPTPSSPISIKNVTGNNNVVVKGKNILPSLNLEETTKYGVTFTPVYENGKLQYVNVNGVWDGTVNNANIVIGSISFESGKTYTISGLTGWGSTTLQIWTASSTAFPQGNRLQCYNGKVTRTAQASETCNVQINIYKDQTYNNVKVYPMVCEENTDDTYEPYVIPQTLPLNLGSIELNKIGTYQDYIYKNNGNWYKKEYVGKVTFTGASGENWSKQSSSTVDKFICQNAFTDRETGTIALSNYFLYSNEINVIGKMFNAGTTAPYNIVFCTSAYGETSKTDFTTWLSTHNTIVKYVKATATDIQITDTTLISQLEAIDNMQSYNGTTIITSTYDSANSQMILGASALKGE